MNAEADGAVRRQDLHQRCRAQRFAKYEARSISYSDSIQSCCQQELHVIGQKLAGAINDMWATAPVPQGPVARGYGFAESEAGMLAELLILTALPLTEAQREQVIADSLRGAPQVKYAWPTAMMLEDIRSEVRRVNVPTLVLSGERDQVDTTERLRQELLPCLAGARFQVLPGAGHLPMLEASKAVAEAIEQFVTGL